MNGSRIFLISVTVAGGLFLLWNVYPSLKKGVVTHSIVQCLEEEKANVGGEKLQQIAHTILVESERYNVDYRLMLALIKVESNFVFNAVSSRGARGFFQIKPSLARYVSDDVGIQWRGAKTLDEPVKNVKFGVYIFSKLVEDFDNLKMALHAYHVGPSRLKSLISARKILDRTYSDLVLNEYANYKETLPAL